MDKNMAEFLEKLANKLGVTVEHLWRILIKQAYIDAIQSLIFIAFVYSLLGLLYWCHKRFSKKNNDGDTLYDEYEEPLIIPMVIIFIVGIILFIVSIFSISNVINGLFNPEYWALHEILNSI